MPLGPAMRLPTSLPEGESTESPSKGELTMTGSSGEYLLPSKSIGVSFIVAFSPKLADGSLLPVPESLVNCELMTK